MVNTSHFKFDKQQTMRCGLQVRNAFVLAPLDLQLSLFDGTVSRNDLWFHQQHSQTVGLDIVGSAYVNVCASTASGSISVANDDTIAGLHQLAQRIHQQGARAILQLSHAGQRAYVDYRYWTAMGPSPTATSVAMNRFEIQQVISDFGRATERVIQAGFDGVELQGANRFLLQQFMSPYTNHRQDEFGGSLANRVRLPIQIVQRVQQVAAHTAQRPFAVGYRLSPEERQPGGLRLIDTLVLAHLLEALQIDYLSLSLHQYHQPAVTGYTVAPVIQIFHDQLKTLPLMVAGGIRNQHDLLTLAEESQWIALGKPMIFNPNWPKDRRCDIEQTQSMISAEDLGISPTYVRQLLHKGDIVK